MAVLNIRIDDHVRDALRDAADDEGVTLSEYVRDLLRESVLPVWEPEEKRAGDEPAPETLRFIDRKMLSMMHRILARVLPEDASEEDGNRDDQLGYARILERGFTGEYWIEAAGFSTELSGRDSRRVIEILEMFRVIAFSLREHAERGAPVEVSGLSYRGFDHNNALEGQMAAYVQHLVDHDRWSELRDAIAENDNGNSHRQMLDVYSRMLAEYRKIMDARERRYSRDEYLLSPDELKAISEARVHPSHREG